MKHLIRPFTLLLLSVSMILLSYSYTPPTTYWQQQGKTHNGILLTTEQIEKADIKLGQLQHHILSHEIPAQGKIELLPEKKATITTPVAGIITAIKTHYGKHVQKGEVLAHLTHPDIITIQKDYLISKSKLDYLEKEVSRHKKLYQNNISAQKKHQQIMASHFQEQAHYEALKIRLKTLGIPHSTLHPKNIKRFIAIKSPISGIITEINTNLMAHADINHILFEIYDPKGLYLQLMVFEKDIQYIHIGQKVIYYLANAQDAPWEATINHIGGKVEKKAKVIKVGARFTPNDHQLYPGMFVAARIYTQTKEVAAVPELALIKTREDTYLIYYTKDKDKKSDHKTFHFLPVEKGETQKGLTQIRLLKPLPPNAQLVIKGAYHIHSVHRNLQE